MDKNSFREKREKRYRNMTKTNKRNVKTHIPYLEKKTDDLKTKFKNKDLTTQKNLDEIVEGIIEGLHEIDDYLPNGINDTLDAVKEQGLDIKNILSFLIPLVNVFNYWKYLTNKYHREQNKILGETLLETNMSETQKANAHDNIVVKLNNLSEPQYKDLIPLAIISITTAYARPPYGSLAGAILSQFTILK